MESTSTDRGKGGVPAEPDYSTMTLVLRVCPHCGEHGVVVVHGDLVFQSIPVGTREDARFYNTELVARGGQSQVGFLTAVEAATYLVDGGELSSLDVISGGVVIMFSGRTLVMTTRRTGVPSGRRSTRSRDPLANADFTDAKVILESCSCGTHGLMTLHLNTGEIYRVGNPSTKEDACSRLDELLGRYRELPEQPEFVEAVKQAHYLTGDMPVQLL